MPAYCLQVLMAGIFPEPEQQLEIIDNNLQLNIVNGLEIFFFAIGDHISIHCCCSLTVNWAKICLYKEREEEGTVVIVGFLSAASLNLIE